MLSTTVPLVLVVSTIISTYKITGFYGTAIAAVGMLSTLGVTMATGMYATWGLSKEGTAQPSLPLSLCVCQQTRTAPWLTMPAVSVRWLSCPSLCATGPTGSTHLETPLLPLVTERHVSPHEVDVRSPVSLAPCCDQVRVSPTVLRCWRPCRCWRPSRTR